MIVDHRGNPLERQALNEPQSARLVHLQREFSNHPSRGLTPVRLASILEEAEHGLLKDQHELFADMEEKDGHIAAEMGKRKRALLGFTWDIMPPPDASADEKRAAEEAKEWISNLTDIEDVILDMADGIGHGFSALEFEWSRNGRVWLPQVIHFRPQTWFTFPQDRQNELRLRDNSPEGAVLQPFGWMIHVHRARSGYLARAGLHRTLAWPYLFKNYSLRDLAELLEIFGLPIRTGTYPRNATDAEKRTLMQALVSLGHNAAGIIPEGMLIEFHEAAKGDKLPFETMIDWCERTQSKVILGATLTSQTDSGSGAMALGNVHHEVMWDLVLSDVRQVQSTLTRQLVWPICALNQARTTDPNRAPRFVFDTQEPEDLKLYAESIPKFVDMGMRIPMKWAHEKLCIPEPDEDEPVLAPAAAAPPTPGTAAMRVSLAALANQTPQRDIADTTLAQLEAHAGPLVDDLLGRIRAMLDQAESLEQFRHLLDTAYPALDEAQLTQLLRLAMTTADLGGRADVIDGD